MAATLVDEPFDHPGWIFEPRFDGLRVLVRLSEDSMGPFLPPSAPSSVKRVPDTALGHFDSIPHGTKTANCLSNRPRRTRYVRVARKRVGPFVHLVERERAKLPSRVIAAERRS
jgi:hypothetical protein